MVMISGGGVSPASALAYEEYPSVRLRTLDKITARTLTFDAQVGNTVKFGDIYIKIQSCRKPPPVEKVESAAFLQIWQADDAKKESKWIFSGWMFASSPALSAMSHPVYDVWVIDCLGKDPEELPKENVAEGVAHEGEGKVEDGAVAEPSISPDTQSIEEQKKDDNSASNSVDAGLPASTDDSAPIPDSPKEPIAEESQPEPQSPQPSNEAEIVDETDQMQNEAPQSDSVPTAPTTPTDKSSQSELDGIY